MYLKFKQGKKSTEKEDINYICRAQSFVKERVSGLGFRSRIFTDKGTENRGEDRESS